jgi:hypothetical protein
MNCKLSIFGFLIGLFPMFLLASPVGTPKATWLEQVKAGVSVPVCKSFVEDESISTQMTVRDINYERCLTLLPTITDKCLQKYDASIPAVLDDDLAEKWGRTIGECIGNDFAVTYLYSDNNIKPKHQKSEP